MSKDIAERRLTLRIRRIALVLILLYVVFLFWNQRKLRRELEDKRAQYQAEIAELEEEIEILEEEVDSSDSLRFIEKIAREELGMVKPREVVVIDKNKKGKNHIKENTR